MNEKIEKALRNEERILVSACLLGIPCRYDCASCMDRKLVHLAATGALVPICPEMEAGLTSPRLICEITVEDGVRKVYNKENKDVTAVYELGARKTLARARKEDCHLAIFKKNSPSCGCGQIFDGTFTGTLTEGDGVATQLLKENHISVITEDDLGF